MSPQPWLVPAARRLARRPAHRHVVTGGRDPRVAIVTDTIDDINGVAIGLRRLVRVARDEGLAVQLVGAGVGPTVAVDADGIVRLPSRVDRELPVYPGMTWSLPFLLPLVEWLVAERIDVVQATTPGPMGMAAMLAARFLRLPVVAQHHTEVGAYAQSLAGPALGCVADAVASSFYRRADLCLAPSRAAEVRLAGYRVSPAAVARVPRGIDLSLFHPARRNRAVLARWGLEERRVVLYVGRLSRAKNLSLLTSSFRALRAARPDAALLVVGDGPDGQAVGGEGVTLAGALHGAALADVFASADVFSFPSETETFGNAIVEAQASGIPVVVSPEGAASECVVPGVTGLVASPVDFAAALGALLDDPSRRARMGRAAARHARRYDLVAAAHGTFDLYRKVAR